MTAPFERAEGDAAAGEEARRALDELGYTGTAPAEARWGWTCPAHLDRRREGSGGCPTCGGPALLIGR